MWFGSSSCCYQSKQCLRHSNFQTAAQISQVWRTIVISNTMKMKSEGREPPLNFVLFLCYSGLQLDYTPTWREQPAFSHSSPAGQDSWILVTNLTQTQWYSGALAYSSCISIITSRNWRKLVGRQKCSDVAQWLARAKSTPPPLAIEMASKVVYFSSMFCWLSPWWLQWSGQPDSAWLGQKGSVWDFPLQLRLCACGHSWCKIVWIHAFLLIFVCGSMYFLCMNLYFLWIHTHICVCEFVHHEFHIVWNHTSKIQINKIECSHH